MNMTEKKILVIGKGFVGDAVGSALVKSHTILYHDPAKGENYNIRQLGDLDGIILCLPTPMDEEGFCDDSLVNDYYWKIREISNTVHVLIKSTTSVATLQNLQCELDEYLTFSPEFLVAANARSDMVNAPFFIYSGVSGKGAIFWGEVFKPCVKNWENAYYTDSMVEAGFVKYAINSFLATKVTFMNELYDLYSTITMGHGNFDNIAALMSLDKRIGASHMQVPGPDGKFGWGGACFPKDTSEFVKLGEFNMQPLTLLETAIKSNIIHRMKDAENSTNGK